MGGVCKMIEEGKGRRECVCEKDREGFCMDVEKKKTMNPLVCVSVCLCDFMHLFVLFSCFA